jgi:hypothetical protein
MSMFLLLLPRCCLQDNYAFAQCKRVLPVSAVRGLGVPLPPAEVDMLEENLTWDEIQVRAGMYVTYLLLLLLSTWTCFKKMSMSVLIAYQHCSACLRRLSSRPCREDLS